MGNKKKRGFRNKKTPEKFAYGSDEESLASLHGDDDSADEVDKYHREEEIKLTTGGRVADIDSALSSDEEAIPLDSDVDDEDDEDEDENDEDLEEEEADYDDIDDEDELDNQDEDQSDDDAIDDDEYDKPLRMNPHIIRAKKDEMDSDIEDKDSDDGLPSSKAWGKKKSIYFGTDYVDKDFRKRAGQEEEEIAQAEEEEAKAIQTRLLEEIKEGDLELDRLPEVRTDRSETVQQVEIDIDSLSRREKLELLKKESPELTSLIDDFKSSLAELNKLKSLLNYVNVDDIDAYRSSLPYRVIKTKFNLVVRYCMNISFYLLLKSKSKSIKNHPCAGNLVNLKKTILEIEKIENKKTFRMMVQEFFDKIETNDKIEMNKSSEELENEEIDLRDYDDHRESQPTCQKRVRFAEETQEDISKPNEDIELRDYGDLREKDESVDEDDEDDEEDQEIDIDDMDLKLEEDDEKTDDGKPDDEKVNDDDTIRRPINYQIAKNKGLTPKKSKEQRNPRVKHRMKYKKAKARRRGQVREPRKEIKKYAGEISGIRSTTVKSIKFK